MELKWRNKWDAWKASIDELAGGYAGPKTWLYAVKYRRAVDFRADADPSRPRVSGDSKAARDQSCSWLFDDLPDLPREYVDPNANDREHR